MTIGALANFCGDTTTTTGVGTVTLLGVAPTGFGALRTPEAAFFLSTGDVVDYYLRDANGTDIESGSGTLDFGSPGPTLSRDVVFESTAGGSPTNSHITLTSGTHEVLITPSASRLAAAMLPQADAQSPTSGDPTWTWNRTMRIDISGLTAPRNLTVTDPPFIGARARVVITADPTSTVADYDHVLGFKGDTLVDLGGAGANTEWSKLVAKGETVTVYATSLTEVDIEIDGRKPCILMWEDAWNTTNNTGYHNIDLAGTPGHNFTRGFTIDTANDQWYTRRNGNYFLSHKTGIGTLTDAKRCLVTVTLNDTVAEWAGEAAGATTAAGPTVNHVMSLAQGDRVAFEINHNDSDNESAQSVAYAQEILS